MADTASLVSHVHVENKQRSAHPTNSGVNVGETERLLSMLGGSALAVYGLTRRSLGGLALMAAGGSLLYRGLMGHCPMYGMLGVNTAEGRGPATSVPAGRGVKVEETVTIDRPPEDLYRFWRNLQNLPRFMRHLESVQNMGNLRSRWTARGPLGKSVSWEAEIITERPNELIGWRSIPGSTVGNAGSVHFRKSADGHGTEVRVVLKYDPPAGKAGAALAGLFGRAPEHEIREDLQRLKQHLEAGA